MKFTTIPFNYEINDVQLQNIKNWITALRSGTYQQHKKSLTNKEHDAFCCLGVACENQKILFNHGNYIFNETALDLTPQYSWFFDTYGFEYAQHVVSCDFEAFHVMDLNDMHGASFNQIADIIEAVFVNKLQLEFEV